MDKGQWNGQESGSTGGARNGGSEESKEHMAGTVNKTFIDSRRIRFVPTCSDNEEITSKR